MFKLTEEENLQLTKAIMALLREWGTAPEQQIRLLGMSEKTKARHMQKYGHNTAFPEDQNISIHIEHIMGIAEALRTTYPLNDQMGRHWLNQPHRRFSQKTPMQYMLAEGLNGLIAVRRHLDCAYDWQQDQERAEKQKK